MLVWIRNEQVDEVVKVKEEIKFVVDEKVRDVVDEGLRGEIWKEESWDRKAD